MTSGLCADDVVVRITTPQIITSQTLVAGGAGGAGARVAASSAAVELGRRLLVAARAGDTQLVLDLMAKGAPFTTDWLGTSALHLAAGGAHAGTCAVLLRAGVSRDARSKVERTPLHLAAGAGHAAVARVLLDAGAAADARDMLRMTPLHWAVQNGHAAAAAELLRAGADPTLRNKFRKSPLELARRLRRADLVRLLEDALRQREAARSVSALVDEQMAEVSTAEPEIETFDAVQRIQDIKLPRPKQNDKAVKEETKLEGAADGAAGGGGDAGGAGGAGGGGGADGAGELLRRHGITLLPADPGGTVLSALQCGRTVVLSDAGKLMLKESSERPSPASNKAGTVSSQPKGVVLTATPVKSPPKPGVKIFTLNNKLLAVPKDNKIPVKKIINPQDMQVKFVQLPPDAKLVSPSKIVPMKAKSRMAVRQGVTSPSARPAVKIIMNKSNFHRLLATAGATQVSTNAAAVVDSDLAEGEEEIALTEDAAPADTSDADSPAALRAQLAAATRALAAARRDLRLARARLAHYERLHDL